MNQRSSNTPQSQLSRVLEFVVDDLKDSPDAELATFLGVESVENAGKEGRRLLEMADRQAARNLLENAKQEVVAFWAKVNSGKKLVDSNSRDLATRLEEFLAKDPDLLDNMTLAARKGEDFQEQDLVQLIEDLEFLHSLSNERKD
jgi:hypothetical protein